MPEPPNIRELKKVLPANRVAWACPPAPFRPTEAGASPEQTAPLKKAEAAGEP
jgi:hypothetical protein